MIRPPAVAGRFYPDDPPRLRSEVDSFLSGSDHEKKIRAIACIVPHAGYVYSGRVAGEVYRRLEIPRTVILIGPRHYPRGAALAINSDGAWQTPLGMTPIDHLLAEKIVRAFPELREDDVAHSTEHALEVQLPFLQQLVPSFAFVPIVIGPAQWSTLDRLGHAFAAVIAAEREPVLLIASSDMNHYESDAVTRVKDRKAIDQILALNPRKLFDTVREEQISMCGYAAAVAVMVAAKELGATQAELIRYATSGEVNGDMQEVVGYAGMVIR
ncbi:MAG TPA: AmmeMemoRadiSam system protein B [Candidatus Saccharimonadales bacterium]|jgi:AmmeMemoRadiSam system protein B|nr:AmmeMemoRadiSam system protein B [Candidatus Saccharimonadales bacterium]